MVATSRRRAYARSVHSPAEALRVKVRGLTRPVTARRGGCARRLQVAAVHLRHGGALPPVARVGVRQGAGRGRCCCARCSVAAGDRARGQRHRQGPCHGGSARMGGAGGRLVAGLASWRASIESGRQGRAAAAVVTRHLMEHEHMRGWRHRRRARRGGRRRARAKHARGPPRSVGGAWAGRRHASRHGQSKGLPAGDVGPRGGPQTRPMR